MQTFAVIGLGRYGMKLARALSSAGAEVIAIDRQTKVVEQIRDDVTLAVRLDSTDEEALKAQGVHEVDVAVVGIGEDFEATALTVALLGGLGVRRIIARAESDVQTRILKRVGASEIASPEGESALRWAHRLMLPDLEQYIELGEDHSIVSMAAPEEFVGKTFEVLKLRRKYGVNVIAIERATAAGDDSKAPTGKRSITVPAADTTVQPGDVLILVGSNDNLDRLPKGVD